MKPSRGSNPGRQDTASCSMRTSDLTQKHLESEPIMTEKALDVMENNLNVQVGDFTALQRMAICFVAGVAGALAVVVLSHILFGLGLSAKLGITAPVSLKSPDIYRPLF